MISVRDDKWNKLVINHTSDNSAPSSFGRASTQAKPNNSHKSWDQKQPLLEFQIHRPHLSNCGIHGTLMYEGFRSLVDNLQPTAVINKKDTTAAFDLCSQMCGVYESEEARAIAVRTLLGKYFTDSNDVMPIISFSRVVNSKNDGGYVTSIAPKDANQVVLQEQYNMAMDRLNSEIVVVGNRATGKYAGRFCAFLYVNVEVKEHMSALAEQGLGYFLNGVMECEEAFRRSRCPCLLVSVAGNYLALHMVAFAAEVTMDPATAFLPLLVMPHDRDAMEGVARTLRAAKNCVSNLQQFYTNLAKDNLSLDGQLQLNFPDVTSVHIRIGDNITRVQFTYKQALLNKKLVFLCCVSEVGESEPAAANTARGHVIPQGSAFPVKEGSVVVIKFTKTYCHQAHVICSNAQAAPFLIAVNELQAGWKIVMMEYMSAASSLEGCPSNVLQEVRPQLTRVVAALHAANYVHGDLRKCNVLYHTITTTTAEDGGRERKVRHYRVCIVDFDWSGTTGEVRYPSFMSESVGWPAGAEDFELILPAHDDYFVAQI